MRKLLLFFIFASHRLAGQDSIQVSLLTVDPGMELYSLFGHTALRVHDLSSGDDKVFNYGTFNFNDKNFYLKFLSGKLNYYLTVESMEDFLYNYVLENRTVYEQVLRLDSLKTQNLLSVLKTNARRENRAYKYDFFWDNCTTRVRDRIADQFSNNLQYPKVEARTYRDYLHDYLHYAPWSRFGIDLILGLPTDGIAATKDAMFLPLEMMKAYDKTFITEQALTTPSTVISPSTPMTKSKTIFTPILVMLLVFIITFLLNALKMKGANWWNNALMLLCGLAGLIIFYLWFISDHLATKQNVHFVWANPLLLLYPWRKNIFPSHYVEKLSAIYFFAIICLFVAFAFIPQKMPVECLAIWASLLIILNSSGATIKGGIFKFVKK